MGLRLRVIIPARIGSTRFPAKPLADIAGLPMIVRTYRQCLKAMPAEAITVATDDERVAEVARAAGADVVLTSSDCRTGTDRVAAAAEQRPADYYVNVQGDEPVFNPADLRQLVAAATANPERLYAGYTDLTDQADYFDASTAKLVLRPDGRILYLSRSPIPRNKAGTFVGGRRLVCAYGLPPDWLFAFARETERTPLEAVEDIEILRFLEMGADLHGVAMSTQSIPVDHPEDLATVVAALSANLVQ